VLIVPLVMGASGVCSGGTWDHQSQMQWQHCLSWHYGSRRAGRSSLDTCDNHLLQPNTETPLPGLWQWETFFQAYFADCRFWEINSAVLWATVLFTRANNTLDWTWADGTSMLWTQFVSALMFPLISWADGSLLIQASKWGRPASSWVRLPGSIRSQPTWDECFVLLNQYGVWALELEFVEIPTLVVSSRFDNWKLSFWGPAICSSAF
jgi:hypothetical protein